MTNFFILAEQGSPGLLGGPIPMFILMGVMFYFLLIRPQKKQRQEQEAMQSSIKKGDKVVTIGGMHSVVHHVSADKVTLKLAEGVFVPFNKASIQSIDKGGKASKADEEQPSEEEKSEE